MTNTMHETTIAEFAELAKLANSDPENGAAFHLADRILARRLHRKLFTVLRYDANTHENERIYSSNQGLYPVGGRKQNADSAYARTVLKDGQPMVFGNDADITANFPDHEKLRSIGISGMICIPVMWLGASTASLNISGEAGQFGAREIPALTVIAGLLAPAVSRVRVV